ncbi:MAG: alkaline phosphatase family protein [Aeromicrobium sp.]
MAHTRLVGRLLTWVIVLGLVVAVVLGVYVWRGHSKPGIPGPSPQATTTPSTPLPTVTKLLVFVVENHSLEQMQAKMPYARSLATTYGYANAYFGITHPSLPNYLVMAGGQTFGVDDDREPRSHQLPGPSVFGAALRAGKTARVYAEDMDSNCKRRNEGKYVARHNPWTYFEDESSACKDDDVPLSHLDDDVKDGQLPAVGMVVPDLCNDAHNCGLDKADDWLKRRVGDVLDGPDWQSRHLAVVITADEDDTHHDNRILTVVAHPSLHGVVVSTRLDHFSLSHSYADVAGVPPLAQAAAAPPLLEAFGLAAG